MIYCGDSTGVGTSNLQGTSSQTMMTLSALASRTSPIGILVRRDKTKEDNLYIFNVIAGY